MKDSDNSLINKYVYSNNTVLTTDSINSNINTVNNHYLKNKVQGHFVDLNQNIFNKDKIIIKNNKNLTYFNNITNNETPRKTTRNYESKNIQTENLNNIIKEKKIKINKAINTSNTSIKYNKKIYLNTNPNINVKSEIIPSIKNKIKTENNYTNRIKNKNNLPTILKTETEETYLSNNFLHSNRNRNTQILNNIKNLNISENLNTIESQKSYRNEKEIFYRKNKANVKYFKEILKTNRIPIKEEKTILPKLTEIKKSSNKLKNNKTRNILYENSNFNYYRNFNTRETTITNLKTDTNSDSEFVSESLGEYYERINKYLGFNHVLINKEISKKPILPTEEENNYAVTELKYENEEIENGIPELNKITLFDLHRYSPIRKKNKNFTFRKIPELIKLNTFHFPIMNQMEDQESLNNSFIKITHNEFAKPRKTRSTMILRKFQFNKNLNSSEKSINRNLINQDEDLIIIQKNKTDDILKINSIPANDSQFTDSSNTSLSEDSSDISSSNKVSRILNLSPNFENINENNLNLNEIEEIVEEGNLDENFENENFNLMTYTNSTQYNNLYKTKFLEIPMRASKISYRIKKKIEKIIYSNNHTNNNKNNINQENLSTENNVDVTFKIKIIEEFLDNQNKENFNSDKYLYRKIFVIVDGTTVLKCLNILGKFIEIPKLKLLKKLKTKKERFQKLYEFLNNVTINFKFNKKFKNIYLMNGNPIYDLIDIPDNHNAIFVCKIII